MCKILLLAVLCLVVRVQEEPTLTLPMQHQRLSHQEGATMKKQLHHLRHITAEWGTETYPLVPMTSIFTLHIVVNGFHYHLSIDTGSSDFFIKGENITGEPAVKFSCESCIRDNQYMSISYLDGQLDTYLYDANVTLGQHSFTEKILVAYASNNSMNFRRVGGILGVSFQEIARNPYPNFINTLINQGIVKKYKFGLKLNFKDQDRSFITFGGIDTSYIDPSWTMLHYPILTQHFHYKVQVKTFFFGGQEFNIDMALIDSGNTCVSISAEYSDRMLEELNKGGNECFFEKETGNDMFRLLICKIRNFDAMPVLRIVMPDGKELSWEKEYYIDKCLILNQAEGGNPVYRCHTFIEDVKGSESLFLGAAFMLKYYASFDLDTKQIGLAKNNENPTLQEVLNKAKVSVDALLRNPI